MNFDYFLHRDSLTGQFNEAFIVKEFERLKTNCDYGAVMIRIAGCDLKPMYKAEELICETGQLVASIVKESVGRTEFGDFVVFAKEWRAVADKVNRLIQRFADEDRRYGVGAVGFDTNISDYPLFMKKLRQAVAIAESIEGKKAIY